MSGDTRVRGGSAPQNTTVEPATTEPDVTPETGLGSLRARMARALEENPDYVTLGEAARILKRGKNTVYEFHSDLPGMTVYGIRLYLREAVVKRARERNRVFGSRIVVTGINVERLRKICEVYYRTQYDIAPSELKLLAKQIARVK